MKKRTVLIIISVFLNYLLIAMSSKDKAIVDLRIKDFDAGISKDHPRLLLKKSEITDFRQFYNKMKDEKELNYIFKNALLNKFDIPFFKEPQRLPGKKTSSEITEMWRTGYENAFKTASTAEHYAFSYLITGDSKYAKESIKWLLYLADWDPNGGIDIKNNDEAFIQSLRPMILAYDWIYDALNASERKTIEANLKARLDILFEWVTSLYMVSKPLAISENNSHKMRFISTIGLGGLALYHELKDAPMWLSWAYEYYNRLFPAWGGEDGGYSEGLDYWRTGHNQHFMFLDAMKVLGLNEVFERKYFKNNGYFALYNVMPFPYSSFGDLCNTQTPNENTAMHIEKYALIYNDPYLMKFHDIIFEKYPYKVEYYNYSLFDSIFQLYRKGNMQVKTANLNDLPRSRYFSDVGWVAMHSILGSKSDDIMLGFKSSPYGSVSHSFADQNSFVINAFGQQLAISSGYREWYGSPHHYGWSKTTISKNAVLFNAKGQIINEASAKGEITRFYTGKNFDFSTGDAKNAFDPALGVTMNLRSIFFINKKYFLIFDELGNKRKYNHQWLLHSKENIIMKANRNEVETLKGNAGLDIKFILPQKEELKFSLTDQFIVPVDSAYAKKFKNEYHFKADAFKPGLDREFITFVYPYKIEQKEDYKTDYLNAKKGNIISIKSKDTEDLIFLSKEADKECEGGQGSLKGKAGVISVNKSQTGFALIEGTELRSQNIFIQSDKIISAEGEISAEKIAIDVQCKDKIILRIKSDFEPKNVFGVSKENVAFVPADKIITLKLSGSESIVLSK